MAEKMNSTYFPSKKVLLFLADSPVPKDLPDERFLDIISFDLISGVIGRY